MVEIKFIIIMVFVLESVRKFRVSLKSGVMRWFSVDLKWVMGGYDLMFFYGEY
ncbi:MAG: hypothetical protein N2166_01835 [candidate division WOR-3 bacterium]|nr:hypothetical protein [candidate division WOR-3 bacterium]